MDLWKPASPHCKLSNVNSGIYQIRFLCLLFLWLRFTDLQSRMQRQITVDCWYTNRFHSDFRIIISNFPRYTLSSCKCSLLQIFHACWRVSNGWRHASIPKDCRYNLNANNFYLSVTVKFAIFSCVSASWGSRHHICGITKRLYSAFKLIGKKNQAEKACQAKRLQAICTTKMAQIVHQDLVVDFIQCIVVA